MLRKSLLGAAVLALVGLSACGSGSSASFNSQPPGQTGVFNVRPGACTNSSSPDCFTATVGCTGTADIGVSVLTTNPTGTVKGTIFLHGGAGGEDFYDVTSGNTSYLQSYLDAGFRVVQVAWDSNWEDTGLDTKSVKSAACRPATLLKYVYDTVHGGPSGAGAMCAQGHSGGSGALAYILAQYHGGSYLDKVMLTSGPVFSDIEQGCMRPKAPAVTICPAAQFGCVGDSWQADPQLPTNRAYWTSDSTCEGKESTTSSASNTAWKAMSIVDGLSDSTFTYPQTAVSGYLCGNGLGPAQAQGGLFYQNFTSSSQTAAFSLYRVDGCADAEDIDDGFLSAGPNAGQPTFTVTVDDMIDGCVQRH